MTTLNPMLPSLEAVFTIEAEIARPVSAGLSPYGERLHIPITGGRVYGKRLQGRVLPGGSDWPLIGVEGNSRIAAHYSIQAEDGTLIYVQNQGLRVSNAEVMQRLRAGEQVDPSEYYFRTAPVFDAPDGAHAWLRERLFIASLMPQGLMVRVDVYAVM